MSNNQWFYKVVPNNPIDYVRTVEKPTPDYKGPFTLFAQAQVHAHNYEEGFRLGLVWANDWVPGGPWFYYPQPWYSPERKAAAQALIDANKAWCEGWRDGMAHQKLRSAANVACMV